MPELPSSDFATRRMEVQPAGRATTRRQAAGNSAELRSLLYQRLRLIAFVMVIACSIDVLVSVVHWLERGSNSFLAFVGSDPWLLFNSAHLAIYAVIGAALLGHAQWSVAALRRVELLLFGTLVLFNSFASWKIASALLAGHTPPSAVLRAIMAPWLLVIVAYGTLIPNLARRCGTVVGLIAALVIGIAVAALLKHGVYGLSLVRALLSMSVQMLIAVCIAIIGAHRLEQLRQESQLARRLGQYQLQRKLGAGGMGEVYLAEHLLLRRPCAIKLIHADNHADSQSLKRFEREVRATATLTHPNTVQIFDFGLAADGTFYYAMEYLPGLNLEQLVERHGPLAPARAVHLLRQLCGSLHEAHGIGLIHRDIKPGNVMITSRGGLHDVVKLLDFGLVVETAALNADSRLTQEGSVTGTPAFMSPEQARGEATLDARSDIYSVGCLAYFMLTGRAPFAGRPAVAMLAAHLYETPEVLTAVPSALRAVIERCLSKQTAARYPDARSLERAFGEALNDTPPWSETEAASWWQQHAAPNTQALQLA